MNPGAPKRLSPIVTLIVLTSILGTAGCRREVPEDTTEMPRAAKVLTIITPHSDRIREAFAAGFWDWYMARHKTPVRVEWIYRGTPQCVDYVRDVPSLRAQGVPARAPDVMFGGGIADHTELAQERMSRSVDLGDALAGFPAEVNGLPTRDAQDRWFATALSSFGILYNEQACRRRGIEPPATWADLADARFHGWVALADPRSSGSHRECMLLILQHEGWEKGWGTLLRILGNARALNARSGDALRQVESGVALATFAVNFDGMMLAAQSDGALRYIDPPGATAVTPDVVSALATASEPELAQEFVRYVLSDQGQALWGAKDAYRTPPGDPLYHYPLAERMYARPEILSVSKNPLQTDFGVRLAPQEADWQREVLKHLVVAACEGDNHVALQEVFRLGLPRPSDGPDELLVPPVSEQSGPDLARQLADDDQRAAIHERWAGEFAMRYARENERGAQKGS